MFSLEARTDARTAARRPWLPKQITEMCSTLFVLFFCFSQTQDVLPAPTTVQPVRLGDGP